MPNQFTNINFDNLPFEKLSRGKQRKRLLKEANYCCSQCGFNKTRFCGGIILEIDHIDGDHKNNTYENLRVLCPNCHALTPNYRNWDRTNKKTSTRFRKGNTNYNKHILSFKQKIKEEHDALQKCVKELYESLKDTGYFEKRGAKTNFACMVKAKVKTRRSNAFIRRLLNKLEQE